MIEKLNLQPQEPIGSAIRIMEIKINEIIDCVNAINERLVELGSRKMNKPTIYKR